MLIVGVILLSACGGVTHALARRVTAAAARVPSEDADCSFFRAPGCPYVPSVAILLNFMLMAQFGWLSHCYLFALIALAIVCYVGYKLLSHARP